MFTITSPNFIIQGDANTQTITFSELKRTDSKGIYQMFRVGDLQPKMKNIKAKSVRDDIKQEVGKQENKQENKQEIIQQNKQQNINYNQSNTFIDVHMFDGSLHKSDKQPNVYSNQEKIEVLTRLKTELKDLNAVNTINVMLSDLDRQGLYTNIQQKDEMDATNILVDICKKEYKEVFDYLQEQLSDTTVLGLCNSGRVNRLYQIWLGLYS